MQVSAGAPAAGFLETYLHASNSVTPKSHEDASMHRLPSLLSPFTDESCAMELPGSSSAGRGARASLPCLSLAYQAFVQLLLWLAPVGVLWAPLQQHLALS